MAMVGMAASATLTQFSTASLSSSASTSFGSSPFVLTLPVPLRFRRTRRSSPLEVWALSSNDFRGGTNIELDGSPWRVQGYLDATALKHGAKGHVTVALIGYNGHASPTDMYGWGEEFLHVKPGKGAAFVRTKLRNYITGNTVERTFRAGEQVDEAQIVKDVMQYTYMDADQYVFMDMATFEETRLNLKDLGDRSKWLKEGMECNVLAWNGRVIDVDLPITVVVKIVETDPGFKGDTAQGGSKPATTETGATVNVPLFINIGDSIQVDTRTNQYMNRVNL